MKQAFFYIMSKYKQFIIIVIEHSIVPVPDLPVPSNEIDGSSTTTSNVLATSSPTKAKWKKSNPS